MNMSITKRNFLGYLSILTLVGGGLGALVLHYLEPGHYFFLVAKVLKMIVSVFLLIIYCVAVPDSAIEFLLTFLAFYLGYLIYESWFFFVFEWNQKLKKKSKKYETVA